MTSIREKEKEENDIDETKEEEQVSQCATFCATDIKYSFESIWSFEPMNTRQYSVSQKPAFHFLQWLKTITAPLLFSSPLLFFSSSLPFFSYSREWG